MRSAPLVAAVLHANAEDAEGKEYQLYCAAYGLEMQIDNEWNVEVVLLAPFQHLHAVTENTEVTGEDTAIVSAGVADIPLQKGGEPDLSILDDDRNNWMLVAGPGRRDTEEAIQSKLRAGLAAGCRVILCFDEIGSEQLASRLAVVDSGSLPRMVIAFVGPDAASPAVATQAAEFVHDCVRSIFGASGGARFIVGGNVTLDPQLEVGLEAEFAFWRVVPEDLRGPEEFVLYNGLWRPENIMFASGTITSIRHPELGEIRKVDTCGLDYTITLTDGAEVVVNAEEDPGKMFEGKPGAWAESKRRVSQWRFAVEFEALSEFSPESKRKRQR